MIDDFTISTGTTRNAARGRSKRRHPAIVELTMSFENSGAGEGIRTLDPNLGKVVLYP